MTRTTLKFLVALAGLALISGSATAAQGSGVLSGKHKSSSASRTTLTSYEEVPALSTPGGGRFTSRIVGGNSIVYRLTYGALTSDVTQAHIHFGQLSVNGGVAAFLCTNLGNGPAGTQTCPNAGVVTGTITAADVIGPAGQGIAAGEFAELLKAIRAGVAYVNVHTTTYPGGEIRGQLGRRH
jgi:hypothetical protein